MGHGGVGRIGAARLGRSRHPDGAGRARTGRRGVLGRDSAGQGRGGGGIRRQRIGVRPGESSGGKRPPTGRLGPGRNRSRRLARTGRPASRSPAATTPVWPAWPSGRSSRSRRDLNGVLWSPIDPIGEGSRGHDAESMAPRSAARHGLVRSGVRRAPADQLWLPPPTNSLNGPAAVPEKSAPDLPLQFLHGSLFRVLTLLAPKEFSGVEWKELTSPTKRRPSKEEDAGLVGVATS